MYGPLKLIVRIKYTSFKARDLMAMDQQESRQALLADLDRFKLPHPPMANVQEPTKDGIEFFWRTFDGSPLFDATLRTFDIVNLAVRRSFVMKSDSWTNSLKKARYVQDMTMEEPPEQPTAPCAESATVQDQFHSPPEQPTASYNRRSYSPPRRAQSPRAFKTSFRRESAPRKPLGPYNGSKVNNWEDRHSGPKYIPMKFKRINDSDYDDDGTTDSGAADLFYGPEEAPLPVKLENTSSTFARLAREYLDVSRGIQNAAARGVSAEEQLLALGAKIPEDEQSFIGASDLDLGEQVQEMELIIEHERIKLKLAEMILEDVLRECATPVVIPELLKMMESGDKCGILKLIL
ncbi:hypothetical protein FB451DRAFT_1390349 [Mycena latifolia]|nr:hypothetical protein FB451DRAFT_1390349 [Mycena latifolia]